MLNLENELNLPGCANYAGAASPGAFLPLVYGDLTQGPEEGVWRAELLDRENVVYGLAGHPLLPLSQGNQVSLYDGNGELIDPSGYTLDLYHDYQGQGAIATAAFTAGGEIEGPVSVRAMGKAAAEGGLLECPVRIARDLLLNHAGLAEEDLERTSWLRAMENVAAKGFKAAGLVSSRDGADRVLTRLLGEFLGSWWLEAEGRVKLMLDFCPGLGSEANLIRFIDGDGLSSVKVEAKLSEVVNRIQVNYRFNPAGGGHRAVLDNGGLEDIKSQGLYGVRLRTMNFKWVRDAQVAESLAGLMLERFSRPRRVISGRERGLTGLVMEKGDTALFSLSWLGDENANPLVNQVVRVLSLEPDLSGGGIQLSLMDTGVFKTLALKAGGACLADGSHQAGGERDMKSY